MNNRELLEHHFYFLSSHRGRRESLSEVELIHSDQPAFNIAFPLSSEALKQVAASFCVYLPDWVETNYSRDKKGSITYMLLSENQSQWKINEQLQIKRAATMSEIEEFSLVQGRGFCEDKDDFAKWYPWMREKNINNLRDKNQFFYLAYENDLLIGISLAIVNENLLGIYAVTTLPEHRGKGVSTTLLDHIVETHQSPNITLQVFSSAYAHDFYLRLGFKDIFNCAIFPQP